MRFSGSGKATGSERTGLFPRIRHLFGREPGIFDEVIREHVRSAVESITHAPYAVDVRVRHGQVTLSGRVHADESSPILTTVKAIPGVTSLEDRLHLREPPSSPARFGQRPAHSARWWPLIAALAGAVAALRPSPPARASRGQG